MKKNENGFSIVEILIITVVIGLVVAVGWLVYDRQNNQNNSANEPVTSSEAEDSVATDTDSIDFDNTPTAADTTQPNTDGYVVIKEWGVKIKMKNAAKAYYKYFENQKGQGGEAGYPIDSDISIEIKPEYITDKGCSPGVGYTRYTNVDDFFKTSAVKIGSFYYLSGGSPSVCENDADTALAVSIRADMGNIVAQ